MPSQVLDDYPIHLSENHSFDFLSNKELPDSYSWSDEETRRTKTDQSVPVIDLQNPNAWEMIGHACRTWGVFQVINHGVPLSLLGDIERETHKLFSLPLEQKLKAGRTVDDISGYGVAHISPFFSKKMWYEGFTVTGTPIEHAHRLWPQSYNNFWSYVGFNLWLEVLTVALLCSDVIQEYRDAVKQLCGRLFCLLLNSLDIYKSEEIHWSDDPQSVQVLQLNSYPTCPDPDHAMGLAPHTDSSILTILYQDKVGGLQVLKEGIGWVTVPPIPTALIVNLGDLSTLLSNGLYHSVMHRALPNKTSNRISLAYFYGPPGNVPISPLKRLINRNNPPLYRTVTWKEYLGIKGKLFNKGLDSVRLSASTQ